MKQLLAFVLLIVLALSFAPAAAQQPLGTPPPGQPLGPQPGTVFIPPPIVVTVLATTPIPPPPMPPAGDPNVRRAVVIAQEFLYGFNLWTDQTQFGCNRAPSMLMLTKPGEHLTVQLNPGRGLAANWVRVLDGWMQDCYIETWALRLL